MDYPIRRLIPEKTEFLVSCYNTPSERARRLFYVVVRGGHLRSAFDYRVERDHLPGHDLLLCLAGSGFVLTGNRRFKVEANEIAWISGHHPHAHWADQADPWELLWLRVDGRAMEETCNILSVPRLPVFSGISIGSLRQEFLRILELMKLRPLALDAMSTQRWPRSWRCCVKTDRQSRWIHSAFSPKRRRMCAKRSPKWLSTRIVPGEWLLWPAFVD
jgi:hypothetical protein